MPIRFERNENKKRALKYILIIFLLCSVVEYVEFLVLKTDQTILAENVLCKLFIIILIFAVLWHRRELPQSIGFKRNGIIKGAALGFALQEIF